jgi:hypothetical protein
MPDFRGEAVESLRKMSLDELANYTAQQSTGHWTYQAGMTEFTFRQTEWQIKAAEAQIKAAEAEERAASAAIESASHAERNARYMLWSVYAAAGSAFISLLATLVSLLGRS